MKYLIIGLGNIGQEYNNTRHNVGFKILDNLLNDTNFKFNEERYGSISKYKFKGRTFILLKPNTYVNLSGKAVQYWLQKEKTPIEKMLIIVDDLALPFGSLKLKPKGGDAGHNGLKNINEILGHSQYSRLRIGIGKDFRKGEQINYVLGKWSSEEEKILNEEIIPKAHQIIKSFGTIGLSRTMNQFNTK